MCERCNMKAARFLADLISGDAKAGEFARKDSSLAIFAELMRKLGWEQTLDESKLDPSTVDVLVRFSPADALITIGLVGPWMHLLADVNTLMVDVIQEYAKAGHPGCSTWIKKHESEIMSRTGEDPLSSFGSLEAPTDARPMAPPVKGGIHS